MVLVLDGGVVTGPAGPRGTSVVMTVVAPGAACTAGGVRLTLEDGGSPQVVCNGVAGASGAAGPAGAVGPAGASVTVAAIDGGACPYGGARLSVDGGAPVFVCNGAPGVAGPAGATGATGATGPAGWSVTSTAIDGGACPYGGARFTGDGGAFTYACNGAPGAAGPAGTSVTVSSLGQGDTSCPYGGVRFTVGTTTTYACNGAPGPQGPPGVVFTDGGYAVGGGSGTGTPMAFAGNEGYSFVGFTSAVYSGNLGGIVGAHAKCHAQFPGAHLCTHREYEVVGSALPVPASGAYVDTARYPSSSAPTVSPRDREYNYTCDGWKATNASAGFIGTDGDWATSSATNACAALRPLTCCRSPQLAWFRGFTTATYTGNLGGIVGAHAKCHAEFPGAHLCTHREYEQAGSPATVPAGGAYVDTARYPSSSAPTVSPRDREYNYTCDGWKATNASAGFIDIDGDWATSAATNACAAVRPLACCSN